MERTGHLRPGDEARQAINDANLEALGREIRAARQLSQGRGLLAVNVMRRSANTHARWSRRWNAASTPWWWAPACRWTCPTWPRTTPRRG
jgi:hypothetical protein